MDYLKFCKGKGVCGPGKNSWKTTTAYKVIPLEVSHIKYIKEY